MQRATPTRWADSPAEFVTCTLTLDLRERLLDSLLDEVNEHQHESIEAAVAARLNPVPVTVWMDPDEAAHRSRGW
ncbi:hypothetical protein [Aeromicrobium sp. UC242_57]|uniref:hypothetical protein n=1 Tax=Aeromicrobium sp. UC242_57 TaxID=3374624 RepID=UPI0037BCEFCA